MRLVFVFLIAAHANADISLSSLRPNTTPPPTVAPPALPGTFLPLCGNGRIDTVADYQRLNNNTLSTFTASGGGSIALFASETCDDGNRLDYDGCSADCMHQDLWATPCALQTDVVLSQMEAMLFFPNGQMIVSTAGQIYSLSAMPAPGDMAIKTTVLLNKTFALTDLFMPNSQQVVGYSSLTQRLYSLSQDMRSLSVLLDLSSMLMPSNNTAFQYGPQDLLVLHDNSTIVIFNLTTGTVRGKCTVAVNLDQSTYFGILMGETLTINLTDLNGVVYVTPLYASPGIQCNTSVWDGSWSSKNILSNSMQVMQGSGAFFFQSYKTSVPLLFGSVYYSMGAWVESSVNSPRSLLAQSGPPAGTWVGHPFIWSSLSSGCLQGASCALDVSVDYDLFANTAWASSNTWMGVLQSLVNSTLQSTPSIVTISDLYANATAYTALMRKWSGKVAQSNAQKPLKDSAVHPITGNMWAIRGDVLYEISKSGVVLPLSNGKCMPSGVAICSGCMWAQAGAQCRPCAQMNQSSWAWSVQCAGCSMASRRLLQTPSALVEFSVVGQISLQTVSCATGATWTQLAGGVWDVKISTTNPAQCLRDLTPVLAGYQVVVKPSIIIPVVPAAQSNDTVSPSTFGAIFGGIMAGIILCLLGCCWMGAMGGQGHHSNWQHGKYTACPDQPRIVLNDVYRPVANQKDI